MGGIEDHLHIAAAIPPSIAVSDFVRQLKGSSSHFVNNKLSLEFKWQNEFGVVSFGQKNLAMVVNYVKSQRQHHSDNSSIAYLEQTS